MEAERTLKLTGLHAGRQAGLCMRASVSAARWHVRTPSRARHITHHVAPHCTTPWPSPTSAAPSAVRSTPPTAITLKATPPCTAHATRGHSPPEHPASLALALYLQPVRPPGGCGYQVAVGRAASCIVTQVVGRLLLLLGRHAACLHHPAASQPVLQGHCLAVAFIYSDSHGQSSPERCWRPLGLPHVDVPHVDRRSGGRTSAGPRAPWAACSPCARCGRRPPAPRASMTACPCAWPTSTTTPQGRVGARGQGACANVLARQGQSADYRAMRLLGALHPPSCSRVAPHPHMPANAHALHSPRMQLKSSRAACRASCACSCPPARPSSRMTCCWSSS